MPAYYFDRNGSTAGFGTLTGTWSPTSGTSLNWSTSALGDVTTTNPGFTSATTDRDAYFGSASVASTTNGSATISGNIYVASISVLNLSGPQVILDNTNTYSVFFNAAASSINTAANNTLRAFRPIRTPASGVTTLTKTGAGTLDTSVSANAFVALGSGTFVVSDGIFRGRVSTGATTLSGTGVFEIVGTTKLTSVSSTATNQVQVLTADATLDSTLALSTNLRLLINATRTFAVPSGMAISGAFSVTQNGDGTLLPNAASSFSGGFTGAAGTTKIQQSIAASGNSILGAGTISFSGGNLLIDTATNSAAITISRNIAWSGATPTVNVGAAAYSVTLASLSFTGATNQTLTLTGTSSATHTVSSALANPSGFVLSVALSDTGTWVFSGLPSYTGTTTVSAGTLTFNNVSRTLTGPVVVSGGTLSNTATLTLSAGLSLSSGTVSALTTLDAASSISGGTASGAMTINAPLALSGGTLSGVVSGTGAVNASAVATLTSPAADGNNAYSGGTSVTGTLDAKFSNATINPAIAGTGKIFGTGAVTVGTGGQIRTGRVNKSLGKVRYAGNLTFSGGSLYIGGAA